MHMNTRTRTITGSLQHMRGASLLALGLLLASTTAQGENQMTMQEHPDLVTMKGTPLTLLGNSVDVGAVAPDFRVVDGAFKPVRLSDFRGRVVLISAVPSLDTGVCSIQTKRFNAEMANLPTNVAVMTISMDLPFAQKRFCEAEKVDRIQVLSDSVWREFGTGYGLLVKDMGLLARCVYVIGSDGRVRYRDLVRELATQPNYDAALAAARDAAAGK